MTNKNRYDLLMLTMIILGVTLIFLPKLADMNNHPEIWSADYVTVINITTKVIGGVIIFFSSILFIFFEPITEWLLNISSNPYGMPPAYGSGTPPIVYIGVGLIISVAIGCGIVVGYFIWH